MRAVIGVSLRRQRDSGWWGLEVPRLRLAVLLHSWWGWGTNHDWAGRQWFVGPLIVTRRSPEFEALIKALP